MWAKQHVSGNNIKEGVVVVNRTDFNYFEVADAIKHSILELVAEENKVTLNKIKTNCFELAKKAEWTKFIKYYDEAFRIALKKAKKRNS